MCLIGVAVNAHPRFPLIVIANRDEFHARPSKPMHWWTDQPILAGRDLEAGGTWFAVSKGGRFAAVTNYRELSAEQGQCSRGAIPLALLASSVAENQPTVLVQADDCYAGYNALYGDCEGVWWASNRGTGHRLSPGIHGLSNHRLNTPWPKVERLRRGMGAAIASNTVRPEQLLSLLHDFETADDEQLPNTGVGLDWERRLSPIFIRGTEYGTRCSTVLRLGREGFDALEVSYGVDGTEQSRRHFDIEGWQKN